MSQLSSLHPNSGIGELTLSDFRIGPNTLGKVVSEQFEQRPNLSGVLVMQTENVWGVISRRRFYERLSQPYSLEIFMRRPIQVFLELHQQEKTPLHLPYSETIASAVRQGLSRDSRDVFEPIVVVFEDPEVEGLQSYFLLDFETLLLAQSHILTLVNQESQQQRRNIEQEKQKVNEYANLLETQQSIIQQRNRALEQQQRQLMNQSQQIESLNRRFMQIGKVLSLEGKKAFQATFAGVNAICQNTNQVVEIGQLLGGELKTIHKTSQLIEQVSRQVRHLSVQASIVANRDSSELSGFSHIASEIAKLVSRTFEAGRQMNLIADRFEDRIEHLTESAQVGTSVARSLVLEIEQAAIALNELDSLVQHQDNVKKGQLQAVGGIPDEATTLLHKLETAEKTLANIREMINPRSNEPIVQKIQRALDQNKPMAQ
jgi:methyl-accepting chemotaxis protein